MVGPPGCMGADGKQQEISRYYRLLLGSLEDEVDKQIQQTQRLIDMKCGPPGHAGQPAVLDQELQQRLDALQIKVDHLQNLQMQHQNMQHNSNDNGVPGPPGPQGLSSTDVLFHSILKIVPRDMFLQYTRLYQDTYCKEYVC